MAGRAGLLLRLRGPMQSWGGVSRFDERPTDSRLSASGLTGLLANALGRRRDDNIDDLSELVHATRVQFHGLQERDYQTSTSLQGNKGVYTVTGKSERTAITPKHYLAGAEFIVAIRGEADLIGLVTQALNNPVYTLYLGRTAHPLSAPPVVLHAPGDLATTDVDTHADNLGADPEGRQLLALLACEEATPGYVTELPAQHFNTRSVGLLPERRRDRMNGTFARRHFTSRPVLLDYGEGIPLSQAHHSHRTRDAARQTGPQNVRPLREGRDHDPARQWSTPIHGARDRLGQSSVYRARDFGKGLFDLNEPGAQSSEQD